MQRDGRHERRARHDDDEDVDVAERVVDAVVAAPERPPGRGEAEAPDRRSGERQPGVLAEREAQRAGRDRDERAHERGDAPEEYRPAPVAIEPGLSPIKVQVRSGVPQGASDPPPHDRTGEVAERARERQHDVALKARVERVAEQHRLRAGDSAGRQGAGEEHRQLATHREERVNGHDDEHGIGAVMADPGGQRHALIMEAES